ncbi:unnamed protein product [Leptosia nina]|uniref:C2H2-type domain-containing protein n=1 Tax=Leptosia nina TaxID=320188 RepID=A0AAV1IX84_9NEOP
MANRRPSGGRRMDFVRNDRVKNFRPGVSPWQGGAPGNDIPNLLPLGSGSTEATLALASNIINLLQPRQNPVPSLLDMPIRRDFGPPMGRYDRGYPPNRMNNQGNFRRTGNYNRSGERINSNRKPFRPNDGQRQQTKGSPKKEADSKNKPKESEQEGEKSQEAEKSQVKQEEKSGQKTRYDDINPQLLKCHICNKSMWDGRSFENHLSGRAHAIMMQKTAESYALTADTMRQEFKIREMKRTRKSGQQPMRDFYCAMCLMYAADGSGHRTTVGHRKLKKYLHPTCTACHKEMPTRIELDEHRLTPEHLKMMQDKQDVGGKPKPEVMMISSLQSEQLYLRDDRDRQRYKKPAEDKDKSTQDKDKDACQEGDEKAAEGDPEEKAEELKEELDKEDTILDYTEGDDIVNISNDRYPAYSTERGVGRSFLSEFKCYQCLLCKKLLDSEETAEVHLRTWRHHQLFVRLLNEKSGKECDEEYEENDLEEEFITSIQAVCIAFIRNMSYQDYATEDQGTDENDNLIDDTTELESPTNIISLDISPEQSKDNLTLTAPSLIQLSLLQINHINNVIARRLSIGIDLTYPKLLELGTEIAKPNVTKMFTPSKENLTTCLMTLQNQDNSSVTIENTTCEKSHSPNKREINTNYVNTQQFLDESSANAVDTVRQNVASDVFNEEISNEFIVYSEPYMGENETINDDQQYQTNVFDYQEVTCTDAFLRKTVDYNPNSVEESASTPLMEVEIDTPPYIGNDSVVLNILSPENLDDNAVENINTSKENISNNALYSFPMDIADYNITIDQTNSNIANEKNKTQEDNVGSSTIEISEDEVNQDKNETASILGMNNFGDDSDVEIIEVTYQPIEILDSDDGGKGNSSPKHPNVSANKKVAILSDSSELDV